MSCQKRERAKRPLAPIRREGSGTPPGHGAGGQRLCRAPGLGGSGGASSPRSPSWDSLLFFLLIEGKNAGAARQTLFFFLNGSLGVQISSFSSPAGTSRAVEGPKRTQNEAVCRVRSGAVQPHCPRPSSSSSSSASSSSQPAPRLPPPPLPFSPCHFSPP